MKQPVARDLDEEQANSGHGQRGHETAGELPNIYIYILLQWQAEWRSRQEGIDIAGELL